jgi:hypothetical protein
MELIMYLTLAVGCFVGIFTFVVGLVSAPTPILVTILVVGLLITQKSINQLNESEIMEWQNQDQEKIESMQIADNSLEKDGKIYKIDSPETMTYRGHTYNKIANSKQNQHSHPQKKAEIKYRGVSISDHQNS